MPRFKPVEKGMLLLPVDLEQQIVPGSFEYALRYLVDHELDLGELRGRFKNDEQGASAYDPAVLLKIVLLAYSRGIVGSRKIESACRQNVLFMAVSRKGGRLHCCVSMKPPRLNPQPLWLAFHA